MSGAALPEKTLCLTFDDGPGETEGDGRGPRTSELAAYLHEEGISATFFMVGKFAAQYPHTLSGVVRLGHTIGNHTFNHPDLPQCLTEGGDLVAEVERTNDVIAGHLSGDTVFFRAPYGSWAPGVADALNARLDDAHHFCGPIHWDIEGRDWEYWKDCRRVEDCAGGYLEEIERIGRGIVLMHDSIADLGDARMNNRTLEMIKVLVPLLKRLGYKFIRLDEITELDEIPDYPL